MTRSLIARRRTATRLALTAVLAVVLTGCGGTNDADGSGAGGSSDPGVASEGDGTNDADGTSDDGDSPDDAVQQADDGDSSSSDGGSALREYTGATTGTYAVEGVGVYGLTVDEDADGPSCLLTHLGVLHVQLAVTEIDGETMSATGSLDLKLALPGSGQDSAATLGHGLVWAAGDSKANMTGTEAPPVELTVDGDTITGELAMVTGMADSQKHQTGQLEITCR